MSDFLPGMARRGVKEGRLPRCYPYARRHEGRRLREIESAEITNAVRELCIEANTRLPEDHLSALRRALEEEESPLGREVIGELLENARVARERCIAFCQDTGYAVFFVELGS